LPYPVTANAELLRIRDVDMTVSNVALHGLDSPHTIAAFVSGTGSSDSLITDSVIKRAEYGVYAVNSGVNVTRNLFEDLLEGAVFIRPPESKDGDPGVTPLLGDTQDVARTGFNRFRMQSGFLVRNMSTETTLAEYNDWGVYTEAEIAAGTAGGVGDVDYDPFIGKPVAPSSIAVEVTVAGTRDLVPDSANPIISLDDEPGTRDIHSSLFIFADVAVGPHTVYGSADGYISNETDVNLSAGEIASVSLPLSAEGEGEGEGPAVCGGIAVNDPLSGPGVHQLLGDLTVVLGTLLALALLSRRRTIVPRESLPRRYVVCPQWHS